MNGRRLLILLLMLLAHAVLAEPALQSAVTSFQTEGGQNTSRVERKFGRGGKIQIRNPSGSITINGWDQDVVRATVTSRDSTEPTEVVFGQTSSGSLTVSPASTVSSKRNLNLNVSLPRDAEIELASTTYGDVLLKNINGAATVESAEGDVQIDGATNRVVVRTQGGSVRATRIGSLTIVSTRGSASVSQTTGAVTIETGGSLDAAEIGGDLTAKSTGNGSASVVKARGLVDLSVVNGSVKVRNADGDVRVASINGGVGVSCVKGRVEISNVNGSIALNHIAGDVDATTSNSSIEFRGAIYAGRRYQLKSHAASVTMTLPADTPGFIAMLSSYSGGMETDFPLVTEAPFSNRRLRGRYINGGDGRTFLQLSSFNGTVNLVKDTAVATEDCRR